MSTVPGTAEDLLEILRYRHRILLDARPEKNPGEFKHRNNFAGNTTFVDYQLVNGTLIRGFEYYKALDHPLSKAIFMMFMISEVHPFTDGNGRIARIMMNAELVAGQQSKIIIPNVYREDYIGALRVLTRQDRIEPFVRMMSRAHKFSSMIFGDDRDRMEADLRQCDAFLEPEKGKLKILKKNAGHEE